MEDGRKLCRAYYHESLYAASARSDSIYESEQAHWDELARASKVAFCGRIPRFAGPKADVSLRKRWHESDGPIDDFLDLIEDEYNDALQAVMTKTLDKVIDAIKVMAGVARRTEGQQVQNS